LADYKEREVLRIMPKCGHTFHLSCIDIWLRKQSTCPVCRLPLKNSSETKHARPVTFTMSQSLDESHTSERNENTERHDEPTPTAASNSLQLTQGEQGARQWSKRARGFVLLRKRRVKNFWFYRGMLLIIDWIQILCLWYGLHSDLWVV